MKKFICILLVFMCILTISACSQDNTNNPNNIEAQEDGELSILVYDYSDSISEAKHKVEYNKWSLGRFNDSKAPQNITSPIQKDSTLTYQYSDVRSYEYFTTHNYKDSDNNEIEINHEGKITMFWSGKSGENQGKVVTESECVKIASDIFSTMANIDDYVVSSSFVESGKYYMVTFRKYIGELKTAETAVFSIYENGHLFSFNSWMLGKIPTDAKVDFDMDKIYPKIKAKLDDIYKDAFEVYDVVKYNEPQYVLTMTSDTEFALACTIKVECINYHPSGESETRGELISMIIF